MTTAQRAAVQWGLVKATAAEIQAFVVDAVTFTPGFREFAAWCRAEGHTLHIVSDGFDLYIEPLLARERLLYLPRTINHLSLDGGAPRFRFQHQNPVCAAHGNCKRWVLEEARATAPAARLVYLGDGSSDLCPARVADVVFARRALSSALSPSEGHWTLLERCRAADLPCHPFDDFHTVRTMLS